MTGVCVGVGGGGGGGVRTVHHDSIHSRFKHACRVSDLVRY